MQLIELGRVKICKQYLSQVICLFSTPILLFGCTHLKQSAPTAREFYIEKKWVRSTLKEEFLGYRRLNRMSPIVLEKMILQANSIDGLVAYDRDTGNQLWRLNLQNGIEGGAAVSENSIYFGASDGQFYSVNLQSGQINWSFPVRAETLAAPSVEGDRVYFVSGTDVVYCLETKSGKQIWAYNRQTTSNFSIRASTKPVIDGDVVYAGFSDGFLVALKKRDGSLEWEKKLGLNKRFRDIDATPVVDGMHVYVSSYDGSLYCLKRETGETVWQVDEGGYLPVTISGEKLYYSSTNGKIIALDKLSGKQIWTHQLTKGIATQTIVHKGYLIFGESEGALRVLDANTARPVGFFEPGRGLVAKPTIVEATSEVYFISNNANLFAMRLGWKKSSELLPWQSN